MDMPSTSSGTIFNSKEHNLKCIVNRIDDESAGEISDSSSCSDFESGDRCAICLGRIKGEFGSPNAEGCDHRFCLLCILEWAKKNPTCPQDRRTFDHILVRNCVGGEIIKSIPTLKSDSTEEVSNHSVDFTFCEVCGLSDREDCLLLCDGCDNGYHMDCLRPPLVTVPIEEWFCPNCISLRIAQQMSIQSASETNEIKTKEGDDKSTAFQSGTNKSQSSRRMIPRTRASERVLHSISITKKKFKAKRRHKKRKRSGKEVPDIVQAFKRPNPHGNISDNDVDAKFFHDDYADKLLKGSLLSAEDRRRKAELYMRRELEPLVSYSGRANHPRVKESPSAPIDLVSSILEGQIALHPSSKHIELREEHPIMSEPLPSQLAARAENDSLVEGSVKSVEDVTSKSKEEERNRHRSPDEHDTNRYNDKSCESHREQGRYDEERHRCDRSDREGHSHRHDRGDDGWEKRRRDSSPLRHSPKRHRYADNYSNGRHHDDHSHRQRSRSTNRRDQHPNRQHSSHRSVRTFWGGSSASVSEPTAKVIDNQNMSLHTMNFSMSDKTLDEKNDWKDDIGSSETEETTRETGLKDSATLLDASNQIDSSLSGLNSNLPELPDLSKKPTNQACNTMTTNKTQKMKQLFGDEQEEHSNAFKDLPTTAIKNVPSHVSSVNTHVSAPSSVETGFSKPEESSPKLRFFTEDELASPTQSTCEFIMNFLMNKNRDLLNTTEPKIPPSRTHNPVNVSQFPRTDEYLSKSKKNISKELNTGKIEENRLSSNGLDLNKRISEAKSDKKKSRKQILDALFGDNFSPSSDGGERKTTLTLKRHSKVEKQTSEGRALDEKYYGKDDSETNNCKIYSESLNDNKNKPSISECHEKTKKHSRIELFSSDENNMKSVCEKTPDKSPSKKVEKMSKFSILFGSEEEGEKEPYIDKKNKNRIATKDSNSSKVSKGDTSITPSVVDTTKKKPSDGVLKGAEGSQSNGAKGQVSTSNPTKVNKVLLESKVVDQAKRFLNPHYQKKKISKEIYKEIISKCVNKVLNVECGLVIEPKKIQKLVDGYVQMFCRKNKK